MDGIWDDVWRGMDATQHRGRCGEEMGGGEECVWWDGDEWNVGMMVCGVCG